MSVDIDKTLAKQLLLKALDNPIPIKDDIGLSITSILRGTHKTYRYVLITALLAKASNNDVDILSLQAKDNSAGAYDARSLCHKVVVPFEREYLPHSLGDSNEPYLNKPARFTRLATSNAVRGGADSITLKKLITILSQITNSNDAFAYLSSSIYVLKQIHCEYESQYSLDINISHSNQEAQSILDFINDLTLQACDGEICPLVVATIESLSFPQYIILPHNVNESGASSKEIGDIDIFLEGVNEHKELISSIEIKDKDFTVYDVQHAIVKFQSSGLKRSLFVYGKNAHFDSQSIYQLAARYGRNGIYCGIISIMDYSRLRLYNWDESITFQLFIDCLLGYAKDIKIKKQTLDWIMDCISKV